MDARDAILGRVREALGRKLGQKPDAPPEPLLQVGYIPREEKLRRFREALEALAGTVYEAESPDAAREHVREYLEDRAAVASNHPFLARCGIGQLPGVKTGITDSEELRNVCASADVGITSAYCLLAETGTIVLRASAEEPRLISLLPPTHIAVVPEERLISDLDEMLSLLPRPADDSSATILITGPSRTGDIEQILVRGVHGPGNVHTVIVRGKGANGK